MTAEEIRTIINQKQNLVSEKKKKINRLNEQIGELEELSDKYTSIISRLGEEQVTRVGKIMLKSILSERSRTADKYISGMCSFLKGKDFNNAYSGLEHSKTVVKKKIIELDDKIDKLKDEIKSTQVAISVLRARLAVAEAITDKTQ